MPAATPHELIVTIVRMLAEAADRSRLTNADQDLLNKKVEELMAYDSDESVRDILRALKHAPFQHSALTQRTVEKLRQRYSRVNRLMPNTQEKLALSRRPGDEETTAVVAGLFVAPRAVKDLEYS